VSVCTRSTCIVRICPLVVPIFFVPSLPFPFARRGLRRERLRWRVFRSAANRLIRPWKSRLALAYVDHRSFAVDLGLILLTIMAIVSRPAALSGHGKLLSGWDLHPLLIRMAARQEPLMAYPPPGRRSGSSALVRCRTRAWAVDQFETTVRASPHPNQFGGRTEAAR
jgi:hypothetical protein